MAGCPLTLAPSEMVVRFGDPVSIKCSTSATDVAEMAWVTPAGDKEFKPGSDVTWMVKNLKWWTPSPFCSITLNDNFQCSVSPVIIVYSKYICQNCIIVLEIKMKQAMM